MERVWHGKGMLCFAAVWVGLGGGMAMGQAGAVPVAAKAAAFEAVTIKPGESGPRVLVTWGPSATGYRTLNAPIVPLILAAYLGVPSGSWDRVKGAPAWAMGDPYDVVAKAEEATITAMKGMTEAQQLAVEAPMLRAMLEERFKLVAHTVPVEVQGYALVVGKHGIKMKVSPPDEPATNEHIRFGRQGTTFVQVTMEELVAFVGGGAAPVVDQTGLTGRYDFVLPRVDTSGPGGEDGAAPAVRPDVAHGSDWEAVGLEMRPIKVQRMNLVVDHIERPTEN